VPEENHAVTSSPLGRVDYADRYSVALPEPMDAPRLCSMILESVPRWLDLLLSARDKVAGRSASAPSSGITASRPA